MKQFQFILGKSPDTTTDLITNGTFASGANWTAGGVTIAAGAASYTTSNGGLVQNNVIYTGHRYRLYVDAKATPTKLMYIRLGKYASPSPIKITSATYVTYEKDLLCIEQDTNRTIQLQSETNVVIDNVKLYELLWNNPIVSDPVGWDTAKITKQKDEILNGLIVEFIADLTFIEDGYDYIYNTLVSDGFCDQIPVMIRKYNSATLIYEDYFEGIIYLTDCEFNLSTKQVRCTIKDNNATQIIKKNKDVKMPLFGPGLLGTSGYGTDFFAPHYQGQFAMYDATGAFPYPINTLGFVIYGLLKAIVSVATDMNMGLTSVLFGTGGTWEGLVLEPGLEVRLTSAGIPNTFNQEATKVSFKDIFDELNKIFNISFSITNVSGVPTIKIEDKESFLSAVPVIALGLVDEVIMRNNEPGFVNTINIGYEFTDFTATGTNQSPEGVAFQTDLTCTDKKLDLVSKWIQSPTVILNLLSNAITSNKYDTKLVIVETDSTGYGTGVINIVGTALDNGSHLYNYDIDDGDNMVRWTNSIQANTFSLQGTGDALSITKTNAVLDKIYEFKYPITKAQFDLITQAYNSIQFDLDGTGLTSKVGYLIEANYNIVDGLTQFKILSN